MLDMGNITERTCSKCNLSKPPSEFYTETRDGKTRTRKECKECFKKRIRINEKKNRAHINERKRAPGSRYKQWRKEYDKIHKEHQDAQESIWRQTPPGVYCSLHTSAAKRKVPFSIEKEAFFEWYRSEPKTCHYCDMTVEECGLYRGHNVMRLTVDRMDSNRGYSLDNMVLACPICNTVKNNVLTYKQMLEVGKMIKENRENGLIQPSYKNGKMGIDSEKEVA